MDTVDRLIAFMDDHEDLPDGAFFALAEEWDIDYDDWAEHAEDIGKRRAQKQP